MGIPELEGLSCCVGTIFGPLFSKKLHVHFTLIKQRREIDDSHHNPRASPANVRTTLVYPQSLSITSQTILSPIDVPSYVGINPISRCGEIYFNTTRRRVLVSSDET